MYREIMNRIKSAKQVYIYNGLMEDYFKISKSELLNSVRQRYKNTKPNGEYYVDELLNELDLNVKLDGDVLYFN